MADIENGTQFSDLPSCLVIDILLRLPIKTLFICRHVRKDWTDLYFSDQYFIRRHLQTSNIQYLHRRIVDGRKLRSECLVDEVSTDNLRFETLDFSCKLPDDDPRYKVRYLCVVNSCNGLVCLSDGEYGSRSIYVCNPILGESVSIPYPKRDCFPYYSQCALGFSVKNNQYKIILCTENSERTKYRWEIYTLGTRRGWRNIETEENLEPWRHNGLDFNTFIHGALHWTRKREKGYVILSFDFETERFSVISSPKVEGGYIINMDVTLGVINGCLWVSFYDKMQFHNGEMWAMKDYGVDKPWTMMLAFRSGWHAIVYGITDEELLARNKELVIYKTEDTSLDKHLFTLNGKEMLLTWHGRPPFVPYSIRKERARIVHDFPFDGGIAYNPSFVSLPDVAKEEQVVS